MGLALKVFFYKKINNHKDRWYYEVKPMHNKKVELQFQTLMVRFLKIHKVFHKSEIDFYRYDKMDIFFNKKKVSTIQLVFKKSEIGQINISYISKLNWGELTEKDLCKIIDTNFYLLVAHLKQDQKNRIRNLAAFSGEILSNGQIVKKFLPSEVNREPIVLDPLKIKKKNYHAPVKFRGYF